MFVWEESDMWIIRAGLADFVDFQTSQTFVVVGRHVEMLIGSLPCLTSLGVYHSNTPDNVDHGSLQCLASLGVYHPNTIDTGFPDYEC